MTESIKRLRTAQHMDRNVTSGRNEIFLPQFVSHRDAMMKFQIGKKKINRSISKRNRMQKTFETDSSDSSNDESVSKSAAHMLRIKAIKSTPGARFLHNEYANILDQHKQCKEEIALMRYELQRHTGEIEMKLEQKLSECIVQMRT